MRKLNFLFFIIVGLTSGFYVIEAQEEPIFADQDLSGSYVMAIHWNEHGERTFAIRARPSSNVFILDDNLNEIKSFDPFSDPEISLHGGGVSILDWNPDGTLLAALIHETVVGDLLQIWDMESNTLESYIIDPTRLISWSPQGDFLAIQAEGKVLIWDINSRTIIHELTLPGIPIIQAMAWRQDPAYSQIAVTNAQGMFQIWEVTTDAANVVMNLNEDNVKLEFAEIREQGNSSYWNLSWEPDSNQIALFDGISQQVEIWDTDVQAMVTSFPISDSPGRLQWGMGGLLIVSFDTIAIFDVVTGAVVQQIPRGEDESFQYTIWHPAKPELIYTLAAPELDFRDLLHTVSIPPHSE